MEELRGTGNPGHLPGGDLERPLVTPGLHLNDHERPRTPLDRNEIDLPVGSPHVSADDPSSAESQVQSGDPLPAATEGAAPVAARGFGGTAAA